MPRLFYAGGGSVAYDDNSLTTVKQLKSSAEKAKAETDTLALAQSVLEARMDAQVTASTDADADYAAEVIDGRVDALANEQASLGANVRDGQSRISEALTNAQGFLQAQIDALTEARLENALNIADANAMRRREVAKEEEYRRYDDGSLQEQINSLSEAVLGILAIISETRERLGGIE